MADTITTTRPGRFKSLQIAGGLAAIREDGDAFFVDLAASGLATIADALISNDLEVTNNLLVEGAADFESTVSIEGILTAENTANVIYIGQQCDMTTPPDIGGTTPGSGTFDELYLKGDGTSPILRFDSWIDQAGHGRMHFRGARGSEAVPAALQNDDYLGRIAFWQHTGADWALGGAMQFRKVASGVRYSITDPSDNFHLTIEEDHSARFYGDVTIDGTLNGYYDTSEVDALLATKQPLDSDLTTLASSITAFGHSLVDDIDSTAARSTLGLGTMATQAASAVAITGGTATFSSSANSLLAVRTATSTNDLAGVATIRRTTTADMVDGFGAGVLFQYADDTSGTLSAGMIGFIRSGADNNTRFRIRAMVSGTETTLFEIQNSACTITPNTTFSGNISVDGNTTLGNSSSDSVTCSARFGFRILAGTTSQSMNAGEVARYIDGSSNAFLYFNNAAAGTVNPKRLLHDGDWNTTVAKGGILSVDTTAANTTSTSETSLRSYTVAASTLASTGDFVQMDAIVRCEADVAEAADIIIKWAGVEVARWSITGVNAGYMNLRVSVIRTGATSQAIACTLTGGNSYSNTQVATGAATLSNANDLAIFGEVSTTSGTTNRASYVSSIIQLRSI